MLTRPVPDDVLARAAEMRAGGKSWEFAARELDFDDPDELRALAENATDAFARLLKRARRDVLSDSFAEGVFTLRRLMRAKDDAVAMKAADCVLRIKMTEIRHRKKAALAPKPKPAAPAPERLWESSEEELRFARFLETQPLAELEELSEVLARQEENKRRVARGEAPVLYPDEYPDNIACTVRGSATAGDPGASFEPGVPAEPVNACSSPAASACDAYNGCTGAFVPPANPRSAPMTNRFPVLAAGAALLGLIMTPPVTYGDEGMWLFSNPPRAQLKAKYGFEPSNEWLEHVQKSSVRFNSGGSGSFVSPDGLVMTNHHVGAGDLDKLSDEKNNYLRDGFHAKTRDAEIKCKGLELNVLMAIKDVTKDVEAAVTAGSAPADAFKARQAKIGEVEKASSDEDKGVRADVVTLYAGGQYHLYTYKKYKDIRLVFAPEKQAAFFGGDPDNFEYPRFDLDMCFFRVYENDKPIKCDHYLKWSAAGSKEDELVFVSGHPGRTNRQNTIAELSYLRDTGYPYLLNRLNRLEVLLNAWGGRSEKNMHRAEEELFSIQNSRKARIGGLGGLMDPALFGRKAEEEKRLKDFLNQPRDGTPEWLSGAKAAFDLVAKAEKTRAEIIKEFTALEGAGGFNCQSFSIARTLLRASEEIPKAPGERLREFGPARLDSLKFQLLSDEPIYEDFEMLKLADGLQFLAVTLGPDHELVKQVLAGKSPRDRAFELVSGTKVRDPKVRATLFDGGKKAVDAANDPMIELARLVDPASRAIRKRSENEVDEPKRQAHAALAKARYAMDGDKVYPDATFTLRLAFGTVKGYTEDGKPVPAFTTMDGLYARSKEQGNKGAFELPKRWEERRGKIDPKTPFNFVCTADIIGGNSGSPVINKNAEVVGLIFDGNIQSLVLDFIFDQNVARAVSVDSRAIVESLRKVYDANDLADELTGAKK